jgi:hypothetical protein
VDPVSLLATGGLKAIELVVAHRRQKSSEQQHEAAALQKEREYAIHLCGCILSEIRVNIERTRYVARRAMSGTFSFGPLDFSFSDPLVVELAQMLPSPPILMRYHRVLATLRRVDFFLRRQAPEADGAPLGTLAAGFAIDAVSPEKKDLVSQYNALLNITELMAKGIYGDNWAGDASSILPLPIDPTKGDNDQADCFAGAQ